jgi:hypothetical protein
MEMGSGCVASSALRSESARSSECGSAAATYESSLKEVERSSAVASMSDDMRLRLAPLEDGAGAAAGAGDGVVVGDMTSPDSCSGGGGREDWEGDKHGSCGNGGRGRRF